MVFLGLFPADYCSCNSVFGSYSSVRDEPKPLSVSCNLSTGQFLPSTQVMKSFRSHCTCSSSARHTTKWDADAHVETLWLTCTLTGLAAERALDSFSKELTCSNLTKLNYAVIYIWCTLCLSQRFWSCTLRVVNSFGHRTNQICGTVNDLRHFDTSFAQWSK